MANRLVTPTVRTGGGASSALVRSASCRCGCLSDIAGVAAGEETATGGQQHCFGTGVDDMALTVAAPVRRAA